MFRFVIANYLLAGLFCTQYFFDSPGFGSAPGAVFLFLAFFAQLGTIVLVSAGALALLNAWRATRPLVQPLGALLFTFLHLFLFIDTRIYALFRFHVNSLVLNVLATPGGLRSAEIPGGQVAVAACGAAGLLAVQYWFFRYTSRARSGGISTPKRPGRAWAALVAVVLFAGLSERALYLWANTKQAVGIVRLSRLVPFYQPVILPRNERLPGIDPVEEGGSGTPPGASLLHYPRRPVSGRVRPDAPNVLWIALDGWRADLLDPETTPEIWKFSRGAQVFRRHVSGGNGTRFGIFSMFYGLHGTYWRPMLDERRGPVLIEKFKEAGYRFRILSSTSLEYPEFSRTVFHDVAAAIEDRLPGETAVERDAAIVDRFGAFVDGVAERERFFSFLFFDASHNPFGSPPAFEKFTPAAAGINFFEIRQRTGMAELFNRYKNSVYYDDHLVGKVLDLLGKRGILDTTLVIITSDHGNEFYEHGYFGYNGAFTPEQIDVPLVISVPGLAPREHDYVTVHQDLPATVLRIAGVTDEPAGYGLGRDLFDASERPYSLPCSFTTCALVDDQGSLVFGADSLTMFRFEARDRNYNELDDSSAAIQSRRAKLSMLLKEMRSFLR